MKKKISLIMAGMMIFTLTACANSREPDNAVQNTEQSSIARRRRTRRRVRMRVRKCQKDQKRQNPKSRAAVW